MHTSGIPAPVSGVTTLRQKRKKTTEKNRGRRYSKTVVNRAVVKDMEHTTTVKNRGHIYKRPRFFGLQPRLLTVVVDQNDHGF